MSTLAHAFDANNVFGRRNEPRLVILAFQPVFVMNKFASGSKHADTVRMIIATELGLIFGVKRARSKLLDAMGKLAARSIVTGPGGHVVSTYFGLVSPRTGT